MANAKARLAQLANRMSDKSEAADPPKKRKKTEDKAPTKSAKQARRKNPTKIEPNPAHGEKGDFVKVTVTLPPEIYELLVNEATRRKINKMPNPQISALLREAAVEYLNK